MKKILTILLVLTMVCSMTACNKTEETGGGEISGHVTIGTPNFNGDFINGWGNNSYDGSIRKFVFGGASNSPAGLMTNNIKGEIVLNSITESREISDNGLVHTFKLKPDLVYSDGTPLTAEDVVFTYEFYLDATAITEAGGSTNYPEYLEKIEKVDDLTIKFTLLDKYYATDSLMFIENILSKDWAMKDKPEDKTIQQHVKDSLINNPLGYGPYKIVEYKENQYIKLTVNDKFIGDVDGDKPKIKDVIVKVISDETKLDELLTANIDVLPGSVKAENIDAVKADDKFSYCNYPRQGYGHLTFHSDFAPVNHKEVRQAISYTIDRKIFREAFLGKYSISTEGPYTLNYWMIDQEWVDNNLHKYTANKEKVDEILSGAGWAKGSDGIWAKGDEKLEIEVLVPNQDWADCLNLTIGKTGEEYGIKFNVALIDWAIFLNHYYGKEISDINERKYHMFALASTPAIVFDGYSSWHSDNVANPWGSSISANSARFVNDKNDELLMTMRTAENDDVYQEAYREWVKLTNEEMPILPLYSNDYHDLYNKRIKGFETNAFWDWVPALIKCTVK
ncbi:ABC transporter substrate-binding protein [Vallitalea sediminicola]